MGFHFLEIWYDLVVQALHSIARGVPFYRCPTSSPPPGPLKNGDVLPFYLIQRWISYMHQALPPPPSPPPVVWWGCGTVPLPPLWCGGGVVWYVGYVWCVWSVWYGMFGKYGMFGMYGRYGMYGMYVCYCMYGRCGNYVAYVWYMWYVW